MADNKQVHSLLSTPSKDKWKRIGLHRRAGILVPLFYIWSRKSLGIGDFHDMKLMIDWCEKTGKSILQLLPMNEVGPLFCPYDSISSFALEPAYLSLRSLKAFKNNSVKEAIDDIGKCYPPGQGHVDYHIKAEKLKLLWDIYLEGNDHHSKDFKNFIEKNAYWINDFALFKTLKEYHGGRPWYEWEERFAKRDKKELANFKEERQNEVTFHMWVQWLLYKQFREARDYASSKDILIKGDLPLLVSRDSADVWAHPEFFKLDYVSGAPPDMYCAKGQRWGMPTYNWDNISADRYRYIKEKMKYAENFYDLLRIDHVVGLFRIWTIPYNEPFENQGLNGFFDPPDENVWGRHGREILSLINGSTGMLICAEDLGVVPKVCIKALKDFGIPGNEVQRWVKDWSVKHDFLDPGEYRLASVSMLSTHDTTNWPAWWENEAGTVDQALFKRKCDERGINYDYVRDRLFDPVRSRHGRLRWLNTVESSETLASILGKGKDQIMDFIDMYENTFKEKEKLWKHLKLKGPMREESDIEVASAVLKFTLDSRSIFSIQLLIDLLGLTHTLKGDPHQYRINMPGTISKKNWSLTMPISLEELLEHKINKEIKKMTAASGRLDG